MSHWRFQARQGLPWTRAWTNLWPKFIANQFWGPFFQNVSRQTIHSKLRPIHELRPFFQIGRRDWGQLSLVALFDFPDGLTCTSFLRLFYFAANSEVSRPMPRWGYLKFVRIENVRIFTDTDVSSVTLFLLLVCLVVASLARIKNTAC